mmetsp:Transcript_3382/g.9711  ORF Transcript_3382/g.9711 Transcript_3382/m.9711 type:complete len:890 (+) Transcript_3382:1230-3899(+)
MLSLTPLPCSLGLAPSPAAPAFCSVQVILSDSNCPGEGEHKVMEYIRQQRNRPGTDPNTKHVVYGLDADLIMLALATHEPHFYILREVVLQQPPSNGKPSFKINANGVAVEEDKPDVALKPFQLLLVAVLREYLALEFKLDNLPFERDVEREYDDLVFMCFFVGNDFLPHSPSLEIREGAIELLMSKYKEMLPELGGYLTYGGEVNLERVEKFIARVSEAEEQIFARRARMLESQRKKMERNKQFTAMKKQHRPSAEGMVPVAPAARGPTDGMRHKTMLLEPAVPGPVRPPGPESNKGAAAALRSQLAGSKRPAEGAEAQLPCADGEASAWGAEARGEGTAEGGEMGEQQLEENRKAMQEFKEKMGESMKEKTDMFDHMIESEKKIRLGEPGWRERYYQEKFGNPPEDQAKLVRDMVKHYIEGVCWVMRYYYDGVASWTWYYPYHYAPFASDLRGLSDIKVSFELGEPFKPFNQLMGVLPAASSHALPKPFQWLFTDPESPLLDFYPKDFKIDINGKRFAWQAVVLLPFIDEKRLLEVTELVEPKLTEDEKFRNGRRLELMYVGPSHSLVPSVLELEDLCSSLPEDKRLEHKQALDTEASGGMAGYIALGAGEACPSYLPAPFSLGDDVTANGAMGVVYINPDRQPHLPKLQEGTVLPALSTDEKDLPPPKTLWHEELPAYMRRGGQGQDQNHFLANNRPQMLSEGAHRHLQHSLGVPQGGRGGYNPYTGGFNRGPGYMGGAPPGGPGGYGAPPGRGYGGGSPQMAMGQAGFGPPPGQPFNASPPMGGYGGRGPPGAGQFMPRGGPPGHVGDGRPMMHQQQPPPYGQPPYGGPMGGPYGGRPPGPVAPHQRNMMGGGGVNPYAALQRPGGGRGGALPQQGRGRGPPHYQ